MKLAPCLLAVAVVAAACGGGDGGGGSGDAGGDGTAVTSDADSTTADQPVASEPAPELDPVVTTEFTLFDSGEAATLADYLGTPIVLNLWASWCPNCITEMPDFERVHQQLGDEVLIVGMNVDDDRARAEELRDATGVTYLLASDADARFQELLGAFAMPATAFITATGQVADVWIGQLDDDKLLDQIDEHLGDRPPAPPPEGDAGEIAAEEPDAGVAAAAATADETFDPAYLNLGPGSRQFIALDDPVLIEAAAATWLEPDDVVMGVVSDDGSEAQAYPIDQMAYHHIANTRLAGEPFVVTY